MKTYRKHNLDILLLLFDQGLEIDINFDAECLVVGFSLISFLLDIVHALTALLTIDFQLFDFVKTG